MNSAEEFLNLAIDLAVSNAQSGKGGPFGAVIVDGGEVVASGVNEVTSRNDPTAHAEIIAIRSACQKQRAFGLAGCDIYTSCEPCPMCLGAIYWARMERIYFACTRQDAASYGFDDESIYTEFARQAPERSIPGKMLLRDEGMAAFRAWRRNVQKVIY